MQIKLVMLASCSCCGMIGGLLTNFFEKMQDTVAHAVKCLKWFSLFYSDKLAVLTFTGHRSFLFLYGSVNCFDSAHIVV